MDLTFSSARRTNLSPVEQAKLSVYSMMGRGNVYLQRGLIETPAGKATLRALAAKVDLNAELKKTLA